MAERLRKRITKVIQCNQTGFVPKQFMKDNVSFMIDAFEVAKSGGTNVQVLK